MPEIPREVLLAGVEAFDAVAGGPVTGRHGAAAVAAIGAAIEAWEAHREAGVRALVAQLTTGEISESQHCVATATCPYTHSHTAAWCAEPQPRRCECAWCYPDERGPRGYTEDPAI